MVRYLHFWIFKKAPKFLRISRPFPFSDSRHASSEFLLMSSMGIKEKVVNKFQPKLYTLHKKSTENGSWGLPCKM